MAAIPPKIPASPLFKQAAKFTKNAALREFRNTQLGRMLDSVRTASARSKIDQKRLGRALGGVKRFDAGRAMRELQGTEFGKLCAELHQYSRGGGIKRRAVQAFLEGLGPAGKFLKAAAGMAGGRTGIQGDLDSLVNVLQAFGYEVLPPSTRRTRANTSRGVDAAAQFLQSLGYKVERPDGEPMPRKAGTLPFGLPPETTRGKPRRRVEVLDSYGNTRRYPANHPMITGEMVPAPDSSNVYSYGYDIENRVFYVRFRAFMRGEKRQKGAGRAGAIYRYLQVEPERADEFFRTVSKGEAVWDLFRVRGTLSGHQKPYELVGIMGGYVPRQAMLTPRGEEFVPRRVETTRDRWLTSQRQRRLVRPLSGGSGNENWQPWQPNRGRPEGPNRGTPNRGR